MSVKISYFAATIAGLSSCVSAQAQELSGKWQFQTHGMTISVVAKDPEYDDRRSYQIVVEDEIRTLSRLEVNRDASITNTWLTDLDSDGSFEIVVTTGQIDGSNAGGVDIHEWIGDRFDSMKPRSSSGRESVGYQGYDQFTFVDGVLIRSYPIFSSQNGNFAPSGETANFSFRFSDRSWVRRP